MRNTLKAQQQLKSPTPPPSSSMVRGNGHHSSSDNFNDEEERTQTLHSMRPNSPQVGDQPTVVLKVGTSSLLRGDCLHLSMLGVLAETCLDLTKRGMRVVVVTSGSVGVGCKILNSPKPKDLAGKQAFAAVGQVHLMRMYEDFFTTLDMKIAQVLLSLDNMLERKQYENARSTFNALLSRHIIPIVNENDTVAVQDVKFGDNDTLSAHVAALVNADYLFLLTDVDGLYTCNPFKNPDAKLISVVENVEDLDVSTDGAGTELGTGGMATKLTAARYATSAGVNTVILNSSHMNKVLSVVEGASVGTLFLAMPKPLQGRKRWILLQPCCGKVYVTKIAMNAIEKDNSLFAAGIISCDGDFDVDDCVTINYKDKENGEEKEIGKAIVNYSCLDMDRYKGKQAEEFFELVGYSGAEAICHKNNICCWVPNGEEPSSQSYLNLSGLHVNEDGCIEEESN